MTSKMRRRWPPEYGLPMAAKQRGDATPYLSGHRRRRIQQTEKPPARPDARPRFTGPPPMDKVRPESQSEAAVAAQVRGRIAALGPRELAALGEAYPRARPSPPSPSLLRLEEDSYPLQETNAQNDVLRPCSCFKRVLYRS